MNSHRFRKTSSPKLTVPIVQEAISGAGVEHGQPVRLGVGDRAARGELHDQVGRLAQRRHGVAQPARVQRGPGLVVADVDVDDAGADRLALLRRGDQLVQGDRQRGYVCLLDSAPVGATVINVAVVMPESLSQQFISARGAS